MSHPFDEISKQRKQQEQEKAQQEKLKKLKEQEWQAKCAEFARRAANYAPMIYEVLNEFGSACWGSKTIFETGFLGINRQRQVKNYLITPLTAKGLTALATINHKYYIQITGDEDSNISHFSVGTYYTQHIVMSDTNEWDETTYVEEYGWSQIPSKTNLEEALAKLYLEQK